MSRNLKVGFSFGLRRAVVRLEGGGGSSGGSLLLTSMRCWEEVASYLRTVGDMGG